MKTYRMNALMTGVLYIMGTVFGVMSAIVGGEVFSSIISSKPLEGVDILNLGATNASRLNAGAFLTFLMGMSLAAMTTFLYPILKKDSEELATGV